MLGIDIDEMVSPFQVGLLNVSGTALQLLALHCWLTTLPVLTAVLVPGHPSSLPHSSLRVQAAASSFICFSVGGAVPLIAAAFIHNNFWRIFCVALASTGALLVFGAIGAYLGGAKKVKAALRVLVGGWLAFLATYGVGKLFGKLPS